MDRTITEADIHFMAASAFFMLVFVSVNEFIVWKHRNDPYYKRSRTVRLFSVLFLFIAITDIFIIAESYYEISHDIVTWLKGMVAIISTVTAISYIKDVSIFSEKKVPTKVIEVDVNKVMRKVREKVKAGKIDPKIKSELYSALNNIKMTNG